MELRSFTFWIGLGPHLGYTSFCFRKTGAPVCLGGFSFSIIIPGVFVPEFLLCLLVGKGWMGKIACSGIIGDMNWDDFPR
ncbi:hypothetical protein VUR80DRAFT_9463 [Thermomyces stellatus]